MSNIKNKLNEAVENPEFSFPERIKYAEELAEIGDDRILTFKPNMIHIKGGEFTMGSSKQEIEKALLEYKHLFTEFEISDVREWFYKEFPAHKAKVNDFFVSKYLVTNQNYIDYLEDQGQKQSFDIPLKSQYNHPVKDVTIDQAKEYCIWLSEKTSRKFRLLTEIEWEWVAMSCEKNFRYPWGNFFNSNFVNTAESGINTTTAVGVFPQGFSIQGVADLAGNVEEWTDTIYKPYPNGKLIKDRLFKFANGTYNVLRGGCYSLHGDLCLSKRRHGFYPKYSITGFRIAETI